MAISYSPLFDSAIVTTGADDLFTLTSGQSVSNLVIRITNYTASAATIDAWVQASAGTEADGDRFLKGVSVGANTYTDFEVPMMEGSGNNAKLSVTAGTGTALVVHHLRGVKRS